jgi:hypothetical protein
MAVTNGYCSLAELKAALRVADAIDDALLELAIESASREIDGYCERVFYSTSTSRIYSASDIWLLQTDDLVSVSSVKTTSDGITYDVTWAPTDYQLEPLNQVAGGLLTPYTRIRAVGNYLFPVWAVGTSAANLAAVQVTGLFGWSSVPTAIRQACVILAMRIFKRLDAPLGMITNDMGSMRVGRFDPDVEALVAPYRKVSAG